MADDADVQSAVDQLAETLDLSVLIEDRRQRPVWWTTRGEVDRTRLATVLERNVSPQAAAVIRRFGLDRATAPVRTPAMPERGMWARWCAPVRHEGKLYGYLWVLDRDESVGDEDLPLLVECAELAGAALAARQRSVEDLRRQRAALLIRLLDGPDEGAARELALLERLPHDVGIQVEAPRRAGGWDLPGR